MNILVAPDKFKGTASAVEVADAIAQVCRAAGHVATTVPLADGGEGTLDALGGANRTATVRNALGRPVEAQWRLSGRHAVVEMAQASGLSIVGGADNNDPVAASTYGTGELIDLAIRRGATEIVVAVGGSATTDGGWGALEAMHPLQRMRGIDITVACDVRTKFVDAATIFGPQKGATVAQVELLRRRLERTAQIYLDERGIDVRGLDRSGAAGGLAGGLASVGAALIDGFEVVADALDLYAKLTEADLVITGEGRLDATSAAGKTVGGVAGLAAATSTPVVVIAGSVAADAPALDAAVHTLVDAVGEAMAFADPLGAVATTTRLALASC